MARQSGSGRDVFVSYRRADTNFVVGHLVDRLAQELGEDRIFRDLDSIPYGTDYRQHTTDSLARCSAALVVIGPDWVGAGPQGRRIDDPTDLVRVEAEAVLARDIPVIPVLVEPGVDLQRLPLPDSLDPLRYRQAMRLRPDPDFDTDAARIAQVLRRMIGLDPTTPSTDDEVARTARTARTEHPARPRRGGPSRLLLALVAAVIVVLGAAVLAVQLLGDDDPGPTTDPTVSPTTTAADGSTTSAASEAVCDAVQVALDPAAGVADDEVALVLSNIGSRSIDLPSAGDVTFVASDGTALPADPAEGAFRGGWSLSISLPAGATSRQVVVVTAPVEGSDLDRVVIDGVRHSSGFSFPTECSFAL